MYDSAMGPVPQLAIAEAIDEIANSPDCFSFVAPYQSTEFPPEPAWLCGMIISYIESKSARGTVINRTMAFTPADQVETPRNIATVAMHFSSEYAEHMPALQATDEDMSMIRLILSQPESRAIDIVSRKRMRTLAAFAVFEATASDQYYSALVVANALLEEIGFAYRQNFTHFSEEYVRQLLPAEIAEEAHQVVQRIKQNNPEVLNKIGTFIAASFLPAPEKLVAQLQTSLGPTRP